MLPTESSQYLMSYIDGSILGYYYSLWCSRIENVVLLLSSLVSFYSFVSGKRKYNLDLFFMVTSTSLPL